MRSVYTKKIGGKEYSLQGVFYVPQGVKLQEVEKFVKDQRMIGNSVRVEKKDLKNDWFKNTHLIRVFVCPKEVPA